MSEVILQVQNLEKFFVRETGERFCLWRNVTFNIAASESIAICGESGSGKSTLLFALGGLEPVDGGSIVFCSCPLTRKLTYHADGISYVFQHYYLIEELTVLENVYMPVRVMGKRINASIKQKAMGLLKELGLEAFAHQLPKTLSGGERQRVAIARALITDPRLILADEPTGSLDELTGEHVMQMFFSVCKQMQTAFILVTHNKHFAQQTDRCYKLEQGNFV